jgi:hypothetical protein
MSLVTVSFCALLGGAWALVVSTYVPNFPLLNRGACQEGVVVLYYVLYLLALEMHFSNRPASYITAFRMFHVWQVLIFCLRFFPLHELSSRTVPHCILGA